MVLVLLLILVVVVFVAKRNEKSTSRKKIVSQQELVWKPSISCLLRTRLYDLSGILRWSRRCLGQGLFNSEKEE